MQQYSDQDWALFSSKFPEWMERHLGKIIDSYQRILDTDTTASNKFWALEERMHQDRLSTSAMPKYRMTRSNMVYNIRALLQTGVIRMDDLAEFSPALLKEIKLGL